MAIPVRDIYLEDNISVLKTGKSPLEERGNLARKTHFFKTLRYLSLTGLAAQAYLIYAKKYTNRSVYLGGFALNFAFYFLLGKWYSESKQKCLNEFKCKEEELESYMYFYRHNYKDNPIIYEINKRA